MTEPKKLTTEEILALARKRKAEAMSGGGEAAAPAPQPPVAPPPAEATTPSAAPAAAPKSTADILAAARAAGAQKAATQAKAASESAGTPPVTPPPAVAPKSTADILAAARAAGAQKAAAAASTAAPKSTADILAAARAAAGAKSAAATASAAPVTPAVAPPAGAPSGERPPLKEMVAAVTGGGAGQPAVLPKPAVAAKPKLPAKPAAKAETVSRRSSFALIVALLMSPFVIAWTALAALGGLWTLGIARFMMPNMILEPPARFKVGPPADFPIGTVSEKFKASRGIYLVHSEAYDGRNIIYALASVCTHLGCTPNWLEGEQKFKCPCHGSGFYISGINFEGPAPRPLERVGIRISEDGTLEVDKSVKFQEELGQWLDTKSYYEVV